MRRRTKIVATLGPASAEPGVLREMLRAGLDVVRLNLSHGDHATHRRLLASARAAAAELGVCLAVMPDLQGPKIRIEGFRRGPVRLAAGEPFALDVALAADAGDEQVVGVSYKQLPEDVAPGDILLLADGLIRLKVARVRGSRVETTVLVGGELSDAKGLNRFGGGLSVAALTDKDREDIRFCAEIGADYMAVSFPRDGADIEQARRLLREAGGDAGIVAKIERREALDNLDEIMEMADAVMIARGDLAVEIGDEELAGVQKDLMRRARARDCVVITATQMMQSMVSSPTPTRAEVLDVGNAVLDDTDAVMLSEETAVGAHPARVLEAMARVCAGTERYQRFAAHHEDATSGYRYMDEAIAKASIDTANRLGARAIAALTESGATALWMSRIGTELPIFAFTRHEATRRKVALYRGVYPLALDVAEADHARVNRQVLERLREEGVLSQGDLLVLSKGDLAGVKGGTNTMKILRLEERPGEAPSA
ncbi:pyruvate kinase [Alkalilimnicola sp. S0819]|uniref:pyruvate kinase n=1 Tax=Alkalilimnicola sp. S0819 TaxID=2613922 RepID=UPI0012624F30|nr:pyruvate kinase [Alkalilimnicola sp. S0819]KAB7628143.1 pyruvate kinase [Alkalilimnicola sp. S0819]MPQ15029.1 pyruvate kinase [Alkalilimnicola sp. S0819]